MDAGDEAYRRLNPVTPPVVDAGFVHPDFIGGLLLEESPVKSPGSDVVAVGSERGGIASDLGFLADNRTWQKGNATVGLCRL
jgi:hypothetical protein